MEFKFVRCLIYKKILSNVEMRGENLSSAVLEKAWKIMAVTLPPLFDFATHRIATFFCEVSSCTCNSECLCYPHLYSSRNSVSHLLGHNFWCSLKRAMIQHPIIWEEWWPGDTDIVNLQIQLINCVTEVSSQTWKIWSPVAPQLKSKQSFFREKSKQEGKR